MHTVWIADERHTTESNDGRYWAPEKIEDDDTPYHIDDDYRAGSAADELKRLCGDMTITVPIAIGLTSEWKERAQKEGAIKWRDGVWRWGLIGICETQKNTAIYRYQR